MSIDPYTEKLWDSELFGRPVLFTQWLAARDMTPKGWYCYDLQDGGDHSMNPAELVDEAVLERHVGTVLSPVPLKEPSAAARQVEGQFSHGGIQMTLRAFCKEHQLKYPARARVQTASLASR